MATEFRRIDLLEELGIEELPMQSFFADMFQDVDLPIHTFMTVRASIFKPLSTFLLSFVKVPARKCPICDGNGQTVWVIPGKCCPNCGSYVGY